MFIFHALRFLIYYPLLRVRVMLGLHQTPNPIDIRWRWDYMKYRSEGSHYETPPGWHLPL